MSKKKILYLNLSTNEKDISLGFSNSWLSKFADKFESVDLISLNISSNNQTEFKNVNIFGISESEKLEQAPLRCMYFFSFFFRNRFGS